jgi:hypothetical protein
VLSMARCRGCAGRGILLPPPLWGRVGEGGKPQGPVLAAHPPPAALCHARALPRASTSPTRGEVTRKCARQNSIPLASAGIRPASCRRRSAQSRAPSDRRGLLPAVPIDARGATSRDFQTSAETFQATARAPAVRVQLCSRQQVKPVRPPPPAPAPVHDPRCVPTNPPAATVSSRRLRSRVAHSRYHAHSAGLGREGRPPHRAFQR